MKWKNRTSLVKEKERIWRVKKMNVSRKKRKEKERKRHREKKFGLCHIPQKGKVRSV